MTSAEKQMVLYLIYEGGADCCQKCIHKNKPSCGRYVSATDYSGECSDDYCIDGMVKYFEKSGSLNIKKTICQHCGKQFKATKYSKVECNIDFYKADGLTHERVTLCPKCWLELFEAREKADDKFYKECVYGKHSD